MDYMLKDDFVSPATYNSLPHISDVASVPDDNSSDLQQLRALLVKYKVPKCVCIRLIHKHLDIKEGKFMVIKTLDIPRHRSVFMLRPLKIAATSSQLHSIHYFVNADGLLQAYEYSLLAAIPDMSNFGPFFVEFCHIVVERGLQYKLELKLGPDINSKSDWTDFEFHKERNTYHNPKKVPKT